MTRSGIEHLSPGPLVNTLPNMLETIYPGFTLRIFRIIPTKEGLFKQHCHPHRLSLYCNSSLWLDTQDTSNLDWNQPNFTLDLISSCSAILATYLSLGIIFLYQLSFVYISHCHIPECSYIYMCVCVCVCIKERERETGCH